MITNANALQSSLAHLLAAPAGSKISMDSRIAVSLPDFESWVAKNDLEFKIEGKKLTLWRKP